MVSDWPRGGSQLDPQRQQGGGVRVYMGSMRGPHEGGQVMRVNECGDECECERERAG